MNWTEFFAMGGYAFYVWASYGVVFVVLMLNIVQPLVQQKRYLRTIQYRKKRRQQQNQDLAQ